MAIDPWLFLFPTIAAATFGALALRLGLKRSELSGLALDWVAAFLFSLLAYLASFVAGAVEWSPPSEVAVASSGAAAGVAFAAALSGIVQRYRRGWLGGPQFRTALFAAAVGLAGFGWGALAGSPGAEGDGAMPVWVAVPIAAAVASALPLLGLATFALLPRAGPVNTLQLPLGFALAAAGLALLATTDILTASALGMLGAGVLYSGATSLFPLAPGAQAPAYAPKVEKPEERAGAPPGVKVRIPKGGAVRVTSFRDDDDGGGGAD